MKNRRAAFQDESLTWIRHNPFATTYDVPQRFVSGWCYAADDALEPSSFFLSVFAFGYCQRQLLKEDMPQGVKISIAVNELLDYFHLWQLKLGTVEIHRKTELKIGPLPLFDFPPGEALEYWREPGGLESKPSRSEPT